MKKYAIIVAGGSGLRMNTPIPKQFAVIAGLPVLMHTINLFSNFSSPVSVIIVLPSKYAEYWKELCSRYHFSVNHHIAEGGPTRFHSVKSGLKFIEHDDSLVAVHDSVRPLVRPEVIARTFKDAGLYGNAIPVVKITESVRRKDGTGSQPVERKDLFVVQTPQCFIAAVLKKAYLQNYDESFTDDATVVESAGEKIHLVDGNIENIKITLTNDLKIAESLLGNL